MYSIQRGQDVSDDLIRNILDKIDSLCNEPIRDIDFVKKREKALAKYLDKTSRKIGLRKTVQTISKYGRNELLEYAFDHLFFLEDRYNNDNKHRADYVKYCGSHFYGDTPYSVTNDMLKFLNEKLDLKNSVFYDIGSGFERVVFFAASAYDLKKVVGVDIAPWRVNYCNNIKKKIGLENVKFVAKDAREHDFSDGDIFYLFNPFTDCKVLENVAQNLRKCKGKNIVSFGDCTDYFDNQEWLKPMYRNNDSHDTPYAIYQIK